MSSPGFPVWERKWQQPHAFVNSADDTLDFLISEKCIKADLTVRYLIC